MMAETRPRVTVDIKGTLADMRGSARHVSLFTRAAVLEAVNFGRALAYELAPVDTGAYRDSIGTSFTSLGSSFNGEFGTDDEKGYWLELGTHSGVDHDWHDGQPHFSLAAVAAERVLWDLIERAVRHD